MLLRPEPNLLNNGIIRENTKTIIAITAANSPPFIPIMNNDVAVNNILNCPVSITKYVGMELKLVAAAKFSDQYIADRFLPDKAIDLIDEAGSRVRLLNSHTEFKLSALFSTSLEGPYSKILPEFAAYELPDVVCTIFAMGGTPGVMSDSTPDAMLIPLLSEDTGFSGIHDTEIDVTGGIFLKVERALQIAKQVDHVWFIDGHHPERMIDEIISNKDGINLFSSLYN